MVFQMKRLSPGTEELTHLDDKRDAKCSELGEPVCAIFSLICALLVKKAFSVVFRSFGLILAIFMLNIPCIHSLYFFILFCNFKIVFRKPNF